MDVPTYFLVATVWAYWFGVGIMVLRVRRMIRKPVGLLFQELPERLMGMAWVPIVLAWVTLPVLAITQRHPLLAIPELVLQHPTLSILRWVAMLCAVLSFILTIECWVRMGRNWRIGVLADQRTELVTDGLYAHVRHPIYAFSILLMLCSAVVVPTVPLIAVAGLHIFLMVLKAKHEERFLHKAHAGLYEAYCRRTGRFVPRLVGRPQDPAAGTTPIALPSSKPCKLNSIQQVIAMWEEMHPYNACHVIRLTQRADIVALRAAIREVCTVAGIGKFVLDRKRGCYQYAPHESIGLQEVVCGESAPEVLSQLITEELNAPFPPAPHHPIRWLVLDDRKTNSHFLMAIYRHLVADSVSMRLLLRRVLNRYLQRSSPEEDEPLQVDPPDYSRVMRHHYWRLGYVRTLFRAVRLFLRLRHVHRIPEKIAGGEGTRCCLFFAPEGLLGRLAGVCKSQELSVGQACLAALYAAMAEITPDRLGHHRRSGLGIGVTVDVRNQAQADLSRTFGLYLGHSITTLDRRDLTDFASILRQVAEGMRVEKHEARFVGPHWNLWIIGLLGRWFGFHGTRAWYRKVYPLAAGLSSLKLTTLWFGAAGDRILDYIRVSPPGPSLPCVLTPTSFGERLNLALTYHESSFTQAEVLRLIGVFVAKLELLASGGGVPTRDLSDHGT